MIFHNPKNLFGFDHDNIIWLMNINQEQKWGAMNYFPSITDNDRLSLVKQQDQQLLFLAKSHEKVLLSCEPDIEFLTYLNEQGFNLPGIILQVEDEIDIKEQLKHSFLIPYIQSEYIDSLKNEVPGIKVFGNELELTKQLNNKYFVRKLMQNHGIHVPNGFICNNIDQLYEAYSLLTSEGFGKCVIKLPYGSSGKGLYVIEDEKSFLNISKYISRRAKSFELLIEGWYPTEKSINSQLLIQEDGVELLAITEQIIDEQGVYRGTNFTSIKQDTLLEEYISDIVKVGNIIRELGYRGIAGIDSIIDTSQNVFPVIEINARFTQVTYLLPVIKMLNEKFSYIESRFIDFELQENVSFNAIKTHFESVIEPDEMSNYIIYTFAKFESLKCTKYRMFIIFFSNNIVDLRSKINKFLNSNIKVI